MTPNDPRHGSVAGYRDGCRCQPCRDANTIYDKKRRLDKLRGIERSKPAVGVRRRIEALQWMGWSLQDIADQAGWKSEQAVDRLKRRTTVSPATFDRVSDLYERLCMTHGPSPRANERARGKGYLPPLFWEDIDSDRVATRPDGQKYRYPPTNSLRGRKRAA